MKNSAKPSKICGKEENDGGHDTSGVTRDASSLHRLGERIHCRESVADQRLERTLEEEIELCIRNFLKRTGRDVQDLSTNTKYAPTSRAKAYFFSSN
jgi:hypothetical protein